MPHWLRLAYGIDRFTEAVGRVIYWLALLMVLVGAFNAIMRYLDHYTGLALSSNVYIELQWYIFAVVFLVGSAYALKHNAHVRVDVIYTRLSPRGKAWINLLGTLLFLIPFCLLMIWMSWPAVTDSWALREMSPDPGGLPRYPIKTVVPIAFLLLLVQGISMLLKQVAILKGLIPGDEQSEQSIGDLGEGI